MKVTLKIHSRFKGKLAKKMNEALAATMASGAAKVGEMLAKIANDHLHSTASLYTDALPGSISAMATRIVIKLDGVAKDIEKGYPSRDMKPQLLASPNAKTSVKGVRYVDIPFQHSLKSLPSAIKAKVQASVKTERVAARWEGRSERSSLRVTGRMSPTDAKHTTSIHSEMLRSKVAGGKSALQTIRRVSSNSDAQAWHHPGYTGLHALRQLKNFPKLVLRSIFKKEMAKRGLK